MKKNINVKILALFILFSTVFFLIACQNTESKYDEIQGYNQGIENIVNENIYTEKKENHLSDDEEDFAESLLNDFKPWNTAYVVFENGDAQITNEVENTSIYMENGDLIVDSTQKMTLVVSGTLEGSIVVNKTDGKFQLILDGVDITANSGPAINLQTEKRVFLVVNDDTTNNIIDAQEHPLMSNGSKTKAAIFSEEQLIISGHGELNITGQYQHGIASDDYLKILSGDINIISTESDGLRANDYIVIDGGNININAKGDGIECEKGYIIINGGKITINSEKQGIKALYNEENILIERFIHINNGWIDITASEKGITANDNIQLNDGALMIRSTGDSISSTAEIAISGGIYFLNSYEKQPVDGNLGVTINGGTALLLADSEEAAIKSSQGSIEISGGTIITAGALDITISQSSQGYLKIGSVQKNEVLDIRLQSSIATIAFLDNYNHVIISSPDIVKDTSYELYSGGSIQGDNFYGLYTSGTYQNGALKANFTAN